MIATGWRFSPILRVQSGAYLTVVTASDIALNGMGNQRLNQLMENVYGDKTPRNYLNPAAFALPATGTVGNMGAGNILGPGMWQFDAALSRTFRIKENRRLEFRAEAFNLTNSFRPGCSTCGADALTMASGVVTNFNAPNFGQITGVRPLTVAGSATRREQMGRNHFLSTPKTIVASTFSFRRSFVASRNIKRFYGV
jgi:hypothetical protein